MVDIPRLDDRVLMKRTSKYGNIRTSVDGIKFASKAEATRYQQLKILEKAGEIKDLLLQSSIILTAVGGVTVGIYRADFDYFDNRKKKFVVEDVKGKMTDLFKWKARHFEAQFGYPITIVKVKT